MQITHYIKNIKSENKRHELYVMATSVEYSESPFIEYIWQEFVDQIEDVESQETSQDLQWEQALLIVQTIEQENQ